MKKYYNIALITILSLLNILHTNVFIYRFHMVDQIKKISKFAYIFDEKKVLVLVAILQVIFALNLVFIYSLVISLLTSVVTKVKIRLKAGLTVALISNIGAVLLSDSIFYFAKIDHLKSAILIGFIPFSWIISGMILTIFLCNKKINSRKIVLINGLLLVIGVSLSFVSLLMMKDFMEHFK